MRTLGQRKKSTGVASRVAPQDLGNAWAADERQSYRAFIRRESHVQRLRGAVEAAEGNVGELRRKGDPEVDELVCSTTIVHTQYVLASFVDSDSRILPMRLRSDCRFGSLHFRSPQVI